MRPVDSRGRIIGLVYIAWSPVTDKRLLVVVLFKPSTQRTCAANESTAEQEQARRLRNTVRLGKTAKTPLIDVLERCAANTLDRNAIDNSAFHSLDAEEVLAVGVNRENLTENLAARQCVINRELHLGRRW